MNGYYPIVVQLAGKECVIVGGGEVAERKASSLLEASASVTFVSPRFGPGIAAWIERGTVKGVKRNYASGDADHAFLVIAATDDPETNERVYRDASARNQLVNVADRPDLSNFIVPATVRRGKLLISVSTSGASPSAAAAIRDEIAGVYGREYEIYFDFMSEFRLKVQRLVKDTNRRRQIFRKMMDADVLGIIRAGRFDRFKSSVMKALSEKQSAFTIEDVLHESDR